MVTYVGNDEGRADYSGTESQGEDEVDLFKNH